MLYFPPTLRSLPRKEKSFNDLKIIHYHKVDTWWGTFLSMLLATYSIDESGKPQLGVVINAYSLLMILLVNLFGASGE